MRRINPIFWGVLCIAFVFGVQLWYPKTASLPALTDKEEIVIEQLFEKAKPQCIGRYVIDVPESFKNENNKSVYDDFNIVSQSIYPPAFKQRIELREQELIDAVNRPENDIKNAPYLKEVIELPEGKGVIFDRNESATDDAYRVLEAHVYINNIAFIITTDIRDFSDKKYEKRKASFLARGGKEVDSNQKPSRLEAMRALISRLNGRLDNEIPTEKGFCIPNGFILDDGDKHLQKVHFIYKNDELLLSFNVDNSYGPSSDTLLSRSDKVNEAMRQQGMLTIKNGELSPNGIPSQEWLMSGLQEVSSKNQMERIPYYNFWLNANQETASLTTPRVLIEINNVDKYTTYSAAEMVEIWDRVISSFRYKPNAF